MSNLIGTERNQVEDCLSKAIFRGLGDVAVVNVLCTLYP